MIGQAGSPLIIAEAGVNHGGDVAQGMALVRAAKSAGADVIKFQYFVAEKIVAANTKTTAYQKINTGMADQTNLLRGLELDFGELAAIAEACRSEGIAFLCTAFDADAIEDLIRLGMDYVKIPSGELTNVSLLRHYGRLGLPVLLSTGMASLEEVGKAIDALEHAGAHDITLLQCTSLYPAPAETLNLRAMVTMAHTFARPVGLSDHSLDDYAAIAAVALGASVIEKHFTLDRSLPGPDHAASLNPDEFGRMVQRLRETACALGDGVKRPVAEELDTARVVRRSWHASRDLAAGTILDVGDVVLKRPAGGLAPDVELIGRRLVRSLAVDAPLTEADLAPDCDPS